jgi:hypothetical protein
MSWTVNDRTTTDEYPADSELEANGGAGVRTGIARRFILTVEPYINEKGEEQQNPIYRQLKTSTTGEAGQAQWQPERKVLPGTETNAARGLFGIRCRSAIAGKPAIVDIEVYGPHE